MKKPKPTILQDKIVNEKQFLDLANDVNTSITDITLRTSRMALANMHRLFIPTSIKEIVKTILHKCHNTGFAAHPGIIHTTELITRHFYWCSTQKNIMEHVQQCDVCQKTKAMHYKPVSSL